MLVRRAWVCCGEGVALHPRGSRFQTRLPPPLCPPLTSLEAGLQHVRGDGHHPVEDPSDAPSHQDPGHAELTDAADQAEPDTAVRGMPTPSCQTARGERAGARRAKTRVPGTCACFKHLLRWVRHRAREVSAGPQRHEERGPGPEASPLLPPDSTQQAASPFGTKWLHAILSPHLFPSGVKIFFSHSYVMKYIPLAGTSVSGKRDVS